MRLGEFQHPPHGSLRAHAHRFRHLDLVGLVLEDMDQAGILASLNFPSIPRFCGQLFWEAKDKDLALLCVKAYNDWMVEEWCAAVPGLYVPMMIGQLWDPALMAKEIRRNAARGVRAAAGRLDTEVPEDALVEVLRPAAAVGN